MTVNSPPPDALNNRIARALQILLRDPSRPLDVGELALAAELSIAQFYRLFHQETGTTPAKLLKAVRMDEALRLVTETSQAIKAIVSTAGYSDVGHFIKEFRRRYGAPPAQARRAKVGG